MNSELRELYQEVILDHYKRPRHWGTLVNPSGDADGHNPLCGDQIHLSVRLTDGKIEDIAFEGAGCAICTASASMMTEAVLGKTADEALELFEGFHAVVTGKNDHADLGALEVLAGVREHPVRIKCATLAWHTLRAALGDGGTASTEE